MMIRRSLMVLLAAALCCHAAESDAQKRAGELFKEMTALVRKNRNRFTPEALAKAEQATRALDRAAEAGEKIGGGAGRQLKWAAERAREDVGDYEKSLFFARKMMQYDPRGGGQTVEARLQMALTYRAMEKFDEAQKLYDAIVEKNPEDRKAVLLPVAEMVYFDIGDRERGGKLLREALMNKDVWGIARYRAVERCAAQALTEGKREEALAWYALVEKMPDERPADHLRYLTRAWYEMGRIQESFGRTDAAKALYRKAMDLEGGHMGYRVRARDAIESIEYFE